MKINFLITNSSQCSQEDWHSHSINNLRFRNVEIELTKEQLEKINLNENAPHFEKIVQRQLILEKKQSE